MNAQEALKLSQENWANNERDYLKYVVGYQNKVEQAAKEGRVFCNVGTLPTGNAGLVDLSARERAGIAAVREMDNRYRSGKYQHTQREMDQMAELCQALIVRHASTDARYECRPFRIDAVAMVVKDHLPEGSYDQVSKTVLAMG